MKSQADKIFSEKLSSLDELPEGYTPNLDSKWTIIQGTVKQKKVIAFRIWAGIAACILILFLSTILWKQIDKPETIIVETPVEKGIVKDNHTSAPVAFEGKKVRIIETVKPVIRKKEEKKAGKKAIVPAPQNDAVTDNEEMPLEIAGVEEDPLTKRKQRYVEVNFDDPVPVQTPAPENSPSAIRIKLGFTKEYPPLNNTGNSSLRIHRNF